MSDNGDVKAADHAQAALRDLMTRLGLSQIEVGEMLGVSAATINRWDNHSAAIPMVEQSLIVAAESSLQRLRMLFRAELLGAVIRRPADLFAGESALQWILRGRIADVVDRYEPPLPGIVTEATLQQINNSTTPSLNGLRVEANFHSIRAQ